MLITPDRQSNFIHAGKKPRCNRLAQTTPISPSSSVQQAPSAISFLILNKLRAGPDLGHPVRGHPSSFGASRLLVFARLQKLTLYPTYGSQRVSCRAHSSLHPPPPQAG